MASDIYQALGWGLSRRRLLSARYRLPPGKYKPLAPKCAASERVKKEVKAGEADLLACLGKSNRCKEAGPDAIHFIFRNLIWTLAGGKSLRILVGPILPQYMMRA